MTPAEAIAAVLGLIGRTGLDATSAVDVRSATNFAVLLTWLAEVVEKSGANQVLLLVDDFDAFADPLLADKLDATLRALPTSRA